MGSTGGICQAAPPGIGHVKAAIFYNSLTFAGEVVARLVAQKHSQASNLKAALLIAVLACLSTRVATSAEPPPCADGQFCDSEGRLQWGGSLRGRLESWRNFAFSPEQDDEFVLGRLLVFADARVSDKVRFFVEGKSALSTDRDLPGGTRPLDVDTLDLQSAYLDLNLGGSAAKVEARIGRQALAFGRQRLVSPLPWGNSLRAWDGARLRTRATGRWQVDAFYTWVVPVDKYEQNARDGDQPFYGLYGAFGTQPQRGIDAYWLHRRRAQATYNGTTGPERRDTFGMRLYHQTGPWRGDLEVAWQTGRVGAFDVNAGMAALEIQRFWEVGPIESLGVGLDYGSGDRSPGGEVQTFDHLFPLAHAYLGYIDIIGRQNVIAPSLKGRFRVSGKSLLEVAAFTFSRARTEDGLYNGGGGIVRPAGSTTERHVGEEVDITWARPIGDAGKLLVGYSHFFRGDFVKASGPSAATHFAYVQYLMAFDTP